MVGFLMRNLRAPRTSPPPQLKLFFSLRPHRRTGNQTALGSTILEAITRFASDFEAALDGSMASVSTSSLSGGARISYIFAETYMQALDNIDPLNGITEEEIRNSIFNATGLRGGMFVPEASFELLAKRSLQMLEEPAVQCVDVVYRELCTLIDVYNTRELQRFTVLREELKRTVHQVLSDCRDPTVELVRFLIQSELAYINTRHPDFVAVMAGETGIVGTSTYASRSNNDNSGHRCARAVAPMGFAVVGRGFCLYLLLLLLLPHR